MFTIVLSTLLSFPPHSTVLFKDFIQQLKQLPITERTSAVEQYLVEKKTTPIIENETFLHFVWFGKASTVLLSGDLQNWSAHDTLEKIPCGENTFFYSSYTVPPDSRLDYQFIVDGTWGTDPKNPRITPSGYGPHSEAAMPRFKSNPNLIYNANVPHGKIDSMFFKSSNDSIHPREIKLYVPHEYENLSDLPTLYVHDGFEALEYESFNIVLDNLIAAKKISPVIVIFIPPVERGEEYVGSKLRDFTIALCNELVPLIDQTYRTSKNPAQRAMMGISNGGHASFAIVLKRPDVFLNAAGQSSTIAMQLFEIFDCTREHLSSHPPFKIYLDVGHYDIRSPQEGASFLQSNKNFSRELTKNGIAHLYHEFNDGHEWANWRERTEEILIYFFGKK